MNYEQAEPYPLTEEWSQAAKQSQSAQHSQSAEASPSTELPQSSKLPQSATVDQWQLYQVTKLKWTKRSEHTSLTYNDHLTLSGIPEQAQDYQVGGRSPLEWVIDRYKVSRDKNSGIINDPNDYCREINRPDYIVDLIKRLITVSTQTQTLVRNLPPLVITEQ